MVYIDTSFIIPYFIAEASSNQVETKLMAFEPGGLAISMWTKTEFASAVAMKVRMQAISPDLARTTLAKFEETVAEAFQILSVKDTDFNLAALMLQQFSTGLRSGDALHLAIAQNNAVERFYTLDKTLVKAAVSLGVAASLGIG